MPHYMVSGSHNFELYSTLVSHSGEGLFEQVQIRARAQHITGQANMLERLRKLGQIETRCLEKEFEYFL